MGKCIPTFDEFWSAWPKREAKKDARRAWDKLRPQDRIAALAAVPAHIARWKREGRARNHIPHPATWLNGERWEDELGEIFAPTQPQRPAQSGPAWWTSHTLMERKGREVGIGPARPGESSDQYRARIQAAIEDQQRYAAASG
ncbi:hypothetical protein ACFOEY_00210 [Paracandidimonas soli]|uniref:hypothetical protein n=1 Tax=Paracandidimonas soli TaxID=1917182 RepID=UPI00360D093E